MTLLNRLIDMRLTVFVGSGIFHVGHHLIFLVNRKLTLYRSFQSGDPAKRARAIVQAVREMIARRCLRCVNFLFDQVTHYNNPKILAEVSEDLGPAMVGLTM